jgi:hypothetical protein
LLISSAKLNAIIENVDKVNTKTLIADDFSLSTLPKLLIPDL